MPPPKWIWKMQVVASSLCSMLCLRIYWLPFVTTRWWDETCESFQLEYGHVECTTDPKPQMLPKIPIIHVPLYQFSWFHPFHNLSNAMKLKLVPNFKKGASPASPSSLQKQCLSVHPWRWSFPCTVLALDRVPSHPWLHTNAHPGGQKGVAPKIWAVWLVIGDVS